MKSLFKTTGEPKVEPVGSGPVPGPNAFEVCVVSFDPDQNMLVVGMANDVQAYFKMDDMGPEGTSFEVLLKDTKLGPRLKFGVLPAQQMPKFSSPEEADAWLEANS